MARSCPLWPRTCFWGRVVLKETGLGPDRYTLEERAKQAKQVDCPRSLMCSPSVESYTSQAQVVVTAPLRQVAQLPETWSQAKYDKTRNRIIRCLSLKYLSTHCSAYLNSPRGKYFQPPFAMSLRAAPPT